MHELDRGTQMFDKEIQLLMQPKTAQGSQADMCVGDLRQPAARRDQ